MFDTKTLCETIGKSERAVRHVAAGVPMQSPVRQRVARAFTLQDALSIVIVDALVAGGLPAATACQAVQDAAGVFERIVADETFTPWSVITTDATGEIAVEFFEDPEDALAAVLALGTAQTLAWADLVRGAMIRLLEAKRALIRGAIDA